MNGKELVKRSDSSKPPINLENIPKNYDFVADISFPPTSDSEKLLLVQPVLFKPYPKCSVDFERFGRKHFEFKFNELPTKDFSKWNMTIQYHRGEAGDYLEVRRFSESIKVLLDETAYLKLDPHSRYGIAGEKSNTIGVLAWLPEQAFTKVKNDGLMVYQLTKPGRNFVIKLNKIMLPGRVVMENDIFKNYLHKPRVDLEKATLYDVDDRFYTAFPETWNSFGKILSKGDINPQSVVFSNF